MRKMKFLAVLTASILTVSATSCSEDKNEPPVKTNTEKVVELLKSIETGATEPIAYINANKYIQHNLGIADGLAGFGEALAGLAGYPDPATVNTVRVFGDGNFVVAHTDYNFFGPKIGFDIFRFENGLIVEHWDNLQEKPATASPSNHTMTDGTAVINDTNKTAENKAFVEQFVKDILMGENPDKLTSYFDGDKYIQHNPAIADGLSGLGAALQWMAENNISMVYDKIHKVLGEGNFVLVISEGKFGVDGGVPTSFYDLFRVENGKIAEHWDVIETIADQSTWKNQNGKFGF
ncbi:MAG: nuclear transport factor 2 family protein [Bacteroidales bacterium]|jgi:predicted SnoaL-like aldol condensation-catalyzing enzyme|nr:nuclear transport factor 2 family protein [Bacteroidales bacterium]